MLPPLTTAWVVLGRTGACARVVVLPHVATMISDFLCRSSGASRARAKPTSCRFFLAWRLAVYRTVSTRTTGSISAVKGLVFVVKHDNLEMVEWLHQFCPSVLPFKAMIEASRLGNVGILEWLAKRHVSAPWLPHMMDAAASTGQLKMLEYLHNHPRNGGCDIDIPKAFDSAVRGGHTETIKWLAEKYGDFVKASFGDAVGAVQSGHFNVTKFLFDHSQHTLLPLPAAIELAAQRGDLAMIQWLFSKATDAISFSYMKPINHAARNGHLRVVQWLHEHHPGGATASAMDNAARRGNLETVQWLHANRTEGCTVNAMDTAAAGGHLAVLQWLHENRTEGCTSNAMDDAAQNGHLDVVKWLHENRGEGCTINAMDIAARSSYLEVVKFLHENRSKGCTINAMDSAAEEGHLEVVKYLHENRAEG